MWHDARNNAVHRTPSRHRLHSFCTLASALSLPNTLRCEGWRHMCDVPPRRYEPVVAHKLSESRRTTERGHAMKYRTNIPAGIHQIRRCRFRGTLVYTRRRSGKSLMLLSRLSRSRKIDEVACGVYRVANNANRTRHLRNTEKTRTSWKHVNASVQHFCHGGGTYAPCTTSALEQCPNPRESSLACSAHSGANY